MKNVKLTAMLLNLMAARARTHPISAPVRAQDWRALQRRVVAARLGGDSRPLQPARALFDDVQ